MHIYSYKKIFLFTPKPREASTMQPSGEGLLLAAHRARESDDRAVLSTPPSSAVALSPTLPPTR